MMNNNEFGDILYQNLNIDQKLHNKKHQCCLFDVSTFLFDEKWKGSDGVRIQFVDDDPHLLAAISNEFEAACEAANLKCDIKKIIDSCSLEVSNVTYDKPVNPEPVLNLYHYILWLFPNKCKNLNYPTETYVGENIVLTRIFDEIDRLSHAQKCVLKLMKERKKLQLRSATSKVDSTFRLIQDMKKDLEKLMQDDLQSVVLESCSVCDCVLNIYRQPNAFQAVQLAQDNENNNDDLHLFVRKEEEELIDRLNDLKIKLAEATGPKNQKRRKKISRKIKDVTLKLKEMSLTKYTTDD